jgi:hypothetical protein
MSFNRLNYDMCQYKQTIEESVGPGDYMLLTPSISCDYCYPWPPTVRLQKGGDSINRHEPLVDIESQLINIHRPGKINECLSFTEQAKVDKIEKIEKNKKNENNANNAKETDNLTHWKNCFEHSVESRYTHPAAELRGTGFNRWEWLCFNPQEKTCIPFDYNISNRIVVKDNHRPCIPTPIDSRLSLPDYKGEVPCELTTPVCIASTVPKSISCKTNSYYSNQS